jgi:hypothetical protein
MKETKKIDFSLPEPQVRNIIRGRVLGVLSGMKVLEELKRDAVRYSGVMAGSVGDLLGSVDKYETLEGVMGRVLSSIFRQSEACYKAGVVFPAGSASEEQSPEVFDEFCANPDVDACIKEVTAILHESLPELDGEELKGYVMMTVAVLSVVLALTSTVDEIYSMDVLGAEDLPLVRAALVGDSALAGLVKASIAYSNRRQPFMPGQIPVYQQEGDEPSHRCEGDCGCGGDCGEDCKCNKGEVKE